MVKKTGPAVTTVVVLVLLILRKTMMAMETVGVVAMMVGAGLIVVVGVSGV